MFEAMCGRAWKEREGTLRKVCTRTRMCKFHEEGLCAQAESCPFAHGVDELRKAPNLRCTKTCPKLLQGLTCDDSSCSFAHSRRELRNVRLPKSRKAASMEESGPKPVSLDALTAPSPAARPGSFQVGADFWNSGPPSGKAKQEVAAPSAGCKAGAIELDAQGIALARQVSHASGDTPPASEGPPTGKYWKTKMCKFFMEGQCKKGIYCRFAHQEDELASKQPQTPPPLVICSHLYEVSGLMAKDSPSSLKDHKFNSTTASHCDGQSTDGSTDECATPEAQSESLQPQEDSSIVCEDDVNWEVRVLNTFLDVGIQPRATASRRSRSLS